MRKRRRWLFLASAIFLAAIVLTSLLEPTRIVRGLLLGKPFYRERPLSYWREVLGRHGREGQIPWVTAGRFHGNEALPVLRACARDPDRNVRWPAVALLGRTGRGSQQALDVLVESLGDEDVEVRLKAVDALAAWGPMARTAIPALTTRLSDPEHQVAHFADLALWQVDPPAAVVACGWRSFTSPEFAFSVMLPGEPEREDQPLQGFPVVAHAFLAWHRVGTYQAPTRYVVTATDYPEEVLNGSTEVERYRKATELVPAFFPGGKVVEEKEVLLGGLRGREHLVEVEGMGRMRNRQFWAGRRLYALLVAFKPQFVNERAVAYFLDSFRLEEKAKTPKKSGSERSNTSP
jgi:hypothetical protein